MEIFWCDIRGSSCRPTCHPFTSIPMPPRQSTTQRDLIKYHRIACELAKEENNEDMTRAPLLPSSHPRHVLPSVLPHRCHLGPRSASVPSPPRHLQRWRRDPWHPSPLIVGRKGTPLPLSVLIYGTRLNTPTTGILCSPLVTSEREIPAMDLLPRAARGEWSAQILAET